MAVDAEPSPPLTYAPPSGGITPRSFRLLLILTLINTILLGINVTGSGLGNFIRQQWADFKQYRADRAIQAQDAVVRSAFLPTQKKCMDYLAPAGSVVYVESPDDVMKMTMAGEVNPVCIVEHSRPWQLTCPVAVANSDFLSDMPMTIALQDGIPLFHRDDVTYIFLHERSTTSGARLVAVAVYAAQIFQDSKYNGDRDIQNVGIHIFRTLHGFVLKPMTAASDMLILDNPSITLESRPGLLTLFDHKGKTNKATYDRGAQLRLFAGQPDPTDTARFTIPYELDGLTGVINGRLTPDDKLLLTPDRGLSDLEKNLSAHPVEVPSPDQHRAIGPAD